MIFGKDMHIHTIPQCHHQSDFDQAIEFDYT